MLETHVPTSTLGECVSFHVLFNIVWKCIVCVEQAKLRKSGPFATHVVNFSSSRTQFILIHRFKSVFHKPEIIKLELNMILSEI